MSEGKRAESQPPFLPEAPKPAYSASTIAILIEGESSDNQYAVQSPVNPAPMMQTSTSRSDSNFGKLTPKFAWSAQSEVFK